MKKLFTLFLIAMSMTSIGQVRISQVYGGGGNASATYNQDFVELFNAGGSSVTIGGWSIQYASATGTSWTVSPIPALYSIGPGQYFLMAMSTTGANGIALPTPDATGGSNMSGTAGKVALVNNTTALSGATACSNPAVVDVLGFGSTASCFETAFLSTTGITNAQSMQRGSGGCLETNNNSTDFTVVSVTPRNSVSPTNSCGGPTPLISVSPNITNLTTGLGTASAEVSYNLSASNLTPASGNITIAPPSGIEISLVSGGPYTTFPATLTKPYTSSGISPSIPVYVRITAGAPQGAYNDTIRHTGGSAPESKIVVTGGVFQNYYNTKTPAAGGLANLNSWSTTTDGTGPSPSGFSSAYQLFNIINQANATYSGIWDVSNAGNTTRVVVGNGVAPLTFTILPGIDSLTSATRVDVLNNDTLVIQNNRRPFLNNLATGSTVDFAQTGTSSSDTIKVPALSFHNLKLSNGIKVLSSGTTTIRGNFTVDNVINFNGAPSPFSTINAFGDVIFQNGSTFEPALTGDGNRITLAMNGNNGLQNIDGNGADLMFFRLRRDTTSTDDDIVLGANTTLTLGNASGGGLQLAQGAGTATTLIAGGTNTIKFIKGSVLTATSLGKLSTTNSNLIIEKANGTTTAGTLRFAGGSTLNNLIVNFDPAITKDSITLADNVIVNGTLTLTKGRIITSPGINLELAAGATVSGGSGTSFIDGKVKRNTSAATGFVFPVGKGATYRPLTVSPVDATASVYTAEYFAGPYSTLTFLSPLTGISNTEYWDLAKNSGTNATVSLTLNGTAVSGAVAGDQISVAHFETGNWVAVNGTAITPGNATTGTAVSSVLSTFSPFTFGILPGGTTYTFNGNGNWSNPANWAGGLIPPLTLTAPNIIIIDPSPGGECVVDVVNQHISLGAQFTINANAKLRILNNLNIQ